MPELADFENCTGCGACKSICPHECIEMRTDVTGTIVPYVNTVCCTNCLSCEKICPALNPVKLRFPKLALAAWNNNDNERISSASGGIASAIYSWVKSMRGISIGALVAKDWTVKIVIAENSHIPDEFRNSKYSFSDSSEVYDKIRKHIKTGVPVVLIGLPCQIAGYKKIFGERDNLFYVDLVCHGVSPNTYLKQHIRNIEQRYNVTAESMSFRAPELGTSNYYFTLYNSIGKIVYTRRSSDGDSYNIAFHRSYSYRENCYHCHYARPERCSDLTLGDYHGLGTCEPCDFDANNVSLILINTDEGLKLIDEMLRGNLITVVERPLNEPIQGDSQLRRPSVKTQERRDFEKYIRIYNGDFEKTVHKVLTRKARRETVKRIIRIPRSLINKISRTLLVQE